ncbi:MAG: aminotransferase class I/II-fold pyridoxal phosphate-dependent enzyme [Chitinophagaceae bacterium]|nr:aminotransferase class I/II-fold pyridoxal phosphate-dependent enzyme [Chitinophagaceae bacterium]
MDQVRMSALAEGMQGSEIVKLGNAIRERKRLGETIYNFTIGDFDPAEFPIPKGLEEEIIRAYRERHTSYPLADGELDLRQAVCAFYKRSLGLDYDVHEIQIAAGGRPLIYTIFKTLVDAGDKVVYAVPSWNNNHYVNLTQAEHCVVEATLENNFMPTAEQLAPHIPGAALLCLCTPQNPTGTTLEKSELEKICELVLAENARRGPGEKKLYVMFDQMYWTLTFGDTQHYNPVSLVPAMKEYTVFVDGISKCFAATGVRVGWSFGPAQVIAKMKAILSHVGAWAPMAEQKATAHFLHQEAAINQFFVQFKQDIQYRLDAIYNGLMALKQKGYAVDAVTPQAAIYLTIRFELVGKKRADGTLLADQAAVTQYLLEEAGLAIVPFYAFGADRSSSWYRLSVGTCRKADLEPMFNRLEGALAKLQ